MNATYFKDLAERALKTAAQTALAAIGTTAALSEVDWTVVGDVTGLAVVLSVLTSLLSGFGGSGGTASLVSEIKAVPSAPEHNLS